MFDIFSKEGLITFLYTLPALVLSLSIHEYAHAWVAYKLGDISQKIRGRLTLNPLAHLDPVGTMLLLVAGFGWGKPVEVNPRNYTRKISMEKGEAIVSLAGPLMNFVLALIFTLIYCAIYKFAGLAFRASVVGSVIILLVTSTIAINVGLGVFNLIPLPPLDGSKIIMPLLPAKAKGFFVSNEQIFYIAFVMLWVTGFAGTIISPVINGVTSVILNLGRLIFGL